jgi:adenylate cyclase
VEIHATAAQNLIDSTWIKRATQNDELIWLGLACFLLSLLILTVRPVRAMILVLSSFLIWSGLAYTSFANYFFLPGAVMVCMVLPMVLLVSTVAYYFITLRRQLQVQRAFEFYVSPEMAREMANNPEALRPGGHQVIATALFTDIAGFTDISETMTAEGVANMLNAYFTEVMDVIFTNSGTLIKFIGDAVFVLWGAPIKLDDHAQKACETALVIQREVERFNATKRFPELHTRIGINTGSMVVGNLGSVKRFDFTAIGDSVNLASRVEGINKYFGTSVMVTEAAWQQTDKSFNSLFMGAIKVVGKKQAIGLHALFESALSQDAGKKWLAAYELFKSRQWDDAQAGFLDAARDEPRIKKAAGLYMSQIESHRKKDPGGDWAGEIIFSSK